MVLDSTKQHSRSRERQPNVRQARGPVFERRSPCHTEACDTNARDQEGREARDDEAREAVARAA